MTNPSEDLREDNLEEMRGRQSLPAQIVVQVKPVKVYLKGPQKVVEPVSSAIHQFCSASRHVAELQWTARVRHYLGSAALSEWAPMSFHDHWWQRLVLMWHFLNWKERARSDTACA
jgi:hypothetical protein